MNEKNTMCRAIIHLDKFAIVEFVVGQKTTNAIVLLLNEGLLLLWSESSHRLLATRRAARRRLRRCLVAAGRHLGWSCWAGRRWWFGRLLCAVGRWGRFTRTAWRWRFWGGAR